MRYQCICRKKSKYVVKRRRSKYAGKYEGWLRVIIIAPYFKSHKKGTAIRSGKKQNLHRFANTETQKGISLSNHMEIS